jgi:hypothetical protein
MVRRTTPTGCVLSKPSACTWSWPMSWTRRAAASSRSRPLRSMSPTRSGQLRSNTAGCPSGTGINVLSSVIRLGPPWPQPFRGHASAIHTPPHRDGVTTMRLPGLPGRLPRWRALADIDGGRSAGPPFCVSTAFRYFALMRLCLAARRVSATPSRPGDRELSAGVRTNNDTMRRQRHNVPWRSRPATADQRVAAARDGLSWCANAAPLLCTTPHGGAEELAPPQHAPFRLITASFYAAQCIS